MIKRVARQLFKIYRGITFKLGVVVVCLMAGKLVAAETIDRPLSSGFVEIKVSAPGESPDNLDTASIGLRRIDTGDLVFCAPAAPGVTLTGESELIQNLGGEILLQAFAFSEVECAGVASLGSDDLYRVVFGAPGKPELLAVE